MIRNTNRYPNLENEQELWDNGFSFVAGIDEAGRGPLAGPVVAAAVVFLNTSQIPKGINDSKKLSKKQREELFEKIQEVAHCYSIVELSSQKIDSVNILNATHLAMKEAISNIKVAQFALIDGLPVKNFPIASKAIVKGDSISISIASASILAKVYRDKKMQEFAKIFPEYSFDKHCGYGTKEHIDAIKKYGPSPIHRKTFEPIKSLFKKEEIVQMQLNLEG